MQISLLARVYVNFRQNDTGRTSPFSYDLAKHFCDVTGLITIFRPLSGLPKRKLEREIRMKKTNQTLHTLKLSLTPWW